MAFTYFFRDMHTLNLIEQHVLPTLKTRRYLDIWDAGCAHGPEPYTLARLLHENMGSFCFAMSGYMQQILMNSLVMSSKKGSTRRNR